jgi:CubicO group peptidase (beta-lactamase class C family)
MLLNGGQIDGKRLLQQKTVHMMTENRLADSLVSEMPFDFGFGFGFAVTHNDDAIHEQRRASYEWAGFWGTHFLISPTGDWAVISMSQARCPEEQRSWYDKYSQMAAEAIDEPPTAPPEEVGVSSEKVANLSVFMQSLVDQGKIAGGVSMMARHGKVIHLKAVGMADREGKNPMRTDSIFRLASMTKPITSVAIMMLWEQGKLGLDDPVSKYIPEFKETKVVVSVDPLKTELAKREITIRHVLTHTSGLGYNFTDTIGPIYDKYGVTGGLCEVTETTLEEMMKKLAGAPLLFHPGDDWEYGLSTDVLGRVVEVASGMTLDRFVAEEICQPLQMTDTFFKAPSKKKDRIVAAYFTTDDGIERLEDGNSLPSRETPDYPYHDSHKYFSGGGGLCSTCRDYMRFCQMLLNGGSLNVKQILRPDTVKIMTVDQLDGKKIPAEKHIPHVTDQFGLGFTIYGDKHPTELLRGAYAWFGFWTTSFRISPQGDWIVVTMSQLAWDDPLTPTWFAEYEKIAAEAVMK